MHSTVDMNINAPRFSQNQRWTNSEFVYNGHELVKTLFYYCVDYALMQSTPLPCCNWV